MFFKYYWAGQVRSGFEIWIILVKSGQILMFFECYWLSQDVLWLFLIRSNPTLMFFECYWSSQVLMFLGKLPQINLTVWVGSRQVGSGKIRFFNCPWSGYVTSWCSLTALELVNSCQILMFFQCYWSEQIRSDQILMFFECYWANNVRSGLDILWIILVVRSALNYSWSG